MARGAELGEGMVEAKAEGQAWRLGGDFGREAQGFPADLCREVRDVRARGEGTELQAQGIAPQISGQSREVRGGIAEALGLQMGLALGGDPGAVQLRREVDGLPGEGYSEVRPQG